MDLSNAWGYGAVIVPSQLFWQGFAILDPETALAKSVSAKTIARAEEACKATGQPNTPHHIQGAIQASLVAVLLHYANLVKMNEIAGTAVERAAAAMVATISRLTGERYWIVEADYTEDGTNTRLVSLLDVQTPEEARLEIERRVMPLKLGLLMSAWRK